MLIKQDGNLQKQHYIYIYALYIVHICTFTIMYTYEMWVNEVFLDLQMTILHFFPAYSVNFSGHLLFCWSWACFFWRIPAYSTYLKYDIAFFCILWHCFIVHGKICLQFTCIFCIFAVLVPYTWKTRDGRKMHQTFWTFRGFRTK